MPGQTHDSRHASFAACKRHLQGHGPRRVREQLLALADAASPDDRADMYGEGPLIAALEAEVAALLGKPAALFMPSGTMAQQIALRIHADRAQCNTVAFHPTCHLELHEQRGYSALHGLEARLIGSAERLIERADLDKITEPLAALLLELPQREIGGVLPSWHELELQVAWARERGTPVHLDGARLWEAAPYYQKSVAEIAGLFDSVYVSFYKTLGAIAGAALAGSKELIAEARIWQRRHGGNLISLYPFAMSAHAGLKTRLGRMSQYRERAVRIASQLAALPRVRVTPDPPHTNMMHITFPTSAERLLDASAAIADRYRVALFTRTRPGPATEHCTVELSIGDAAEELGDEELSGWFRELLLDACGDEGLAKPRPG